MTAVLACKSGRRVPPLTPGLGAIDICLTDRGIAMSVGPHDSWSPLHLYIEQ